MVLATQKRRLKRMVRETRTKARNYKTIASFTYCKVSFSDIN
jgi:hypothetical protein